MNPHAFILTPPPLSAKRGDSQPLAFSIYQHRPFPSITGYGGRLQWTNLDTLSPNQYQNQTGPHLPTTFTLHQLRSDLLNVCGDRRDHAGYNGNPGAIVYRGQSLGELSATVQLAGAWEHVRWNVTGAAAKWLADSLDQWLIDTIKAQLPQLQAEAIAGVRASMYEQVQAIRDSIERLESEASAIIGSVA